MSQTTHPTSPWGTRTERARERAAKRDAVLATAVRLFNEKGFHATSIEDVAKALEVTKPTIYHYFSSKDEILFECVRLGLDAIREAAAEAAARGGSGCARLRDLVRAYAIVMTRDVGACVSRTSDDQLSPDSARRFRAMKREIHALLEEVVAQGMADGSLVAGDAKITAFTLAGAINGLPRWYRADGPLSAEAVAEGLACTLLDGVARRD